MLSKVNTLCITEIKWLYSVGVRTDISKEMTLSAN